MNCPRCGTPMQGVCPNCGFPVTRVNVMLRNDVNIVDLFDGYNGEYEPEEFDWGDPVGREVW